MAMFASMGRALRLFGTPAFFGVLMKSVLLTLLLFALGCAALEYLVTVLPLPPMAERALEWLAPVLVFVLLWLLGGPVAALFAGLFLDGLAGQIEARDYPGDPAAPGLPLMAGLRTGLSLTLLVLGVDIALLPLDVLVPGPGEVATLLANAWLLGREYFELAALRHLPPDQVAALRQRFRPGITMGGLLIALLSMVPLLNLIAPLFGVALMVHLFKRIQHETAA
jgi:CysZ protein